MSTRRFWYVTALAMHFFIVWLVFWPRAQTFPHRHWILIFCSHASTHVSKALLSPRSPRCHLSLYRNAFKVYSYQTKIGPTKKKSRSEVFKMWRWFSMVGGGRDCEMKVVSIFFSCGFAVSPASHAPPYAACRCGQSMRIWLRNNTHFSYASNLIWMTLVKALHPPHALLLPLSFSLPLPGFTHVCFINFNLFIFTV